MNETLPLERPGLIARWLSNRELQFWLVQWVGWTSWAFASAIGWVYWMDNPDRPHVIALYTFAALAGMLLSSALRYAGSRADRRRRSAGAARAAPAPQ